MEQPNPFEQIAELRAERGETLAQFALVVGIGSKGRLSEMEKGLVRPTVAQALAIEKLSGGRIDAAALNADVAASRKKLCTDHAPPLSSARALTRSPPPTCTRCPKCEEPRTEEDTGRCGFAGCPYAPPQQEMGDAPCAP